MAESGAQAPGIVGSLIVLLRPTAEGWERSPIYRDDPHHEGRWVWIKNGKLDKYRWFVSKLFFDWGMLYFCIVFSGLSLNRMQPYLQYRQVRQAVDSHLHNMTDDLGSNNDSDKQFHGKNGPIVAPSLRQYWFHLEAAKEQGILCANLAYPTTFNVRSCSAN